MNHDPSHFPGVSRAAGPSLATPLAAPVTLRPRHDGWTAERQRIFLETLADTGCVTDACKAADVSAQSAYRLRRHPEAQAFLVGWNHALRLATGRLAAIALDRAVNGTVSEVWHDGRCVAYTRTPSNSLLMFLLRTQDPDRYGIFAGISVKRTPFVAVSAEALPCALDALTDIDAPAMIDPDEHAHLPDTARAPT